MFIVLFRTSTRRSRLVSWETGEGRNWHAHHLPLTPAFAFCRKWGYNAYIPIISGVAYISTIFVLKVGRSLFFMLFRLQIAGGAESNLPSQTQRFMQNREAMKLRWLCAIHNFGLSFFSLAVLIGQTYETVLAAQVISILCKILESRPHTQT